jgi:LPS-assembly protein
MSSKQLRRARPRLARRGAAAFAARVRRRILLLFTLPALLCRAASTPRLDLHADRTEFSDEGAVGHGHVIFRDPGLYLTADDFAFAAATNTFTATGHVVLTRESVRVLADTIVYRRTERTFHAEHVRLGSAPFYAEGDAADGTATEITVRHAKVSYGEPGPWQPTLSADSVTYAPNRRLRSENSFVGLGHGQLLPIPRFEQNLAAPFITYAAVNGGYRSSLGVFVEGGLHLPTALGVRMGGDLGFYSNRGLLFGPSGSYASGDNGQAWHGFFRSGYINDHGDKKTDVLGQPVPENRGFVEWQHDQQLGEHLTLTAQLNWWRDSEVVRDFRPRAFFPVQEPDTYVEAVYTGQNYFASAFARFQPNTFQRVQERLPELRFDLLPTPIGAGFLERLNASFVRLREDPLPRLAAVGAPLSTLQTDRLDIYYGLERPIVPADWLTITPVAGGRFTHYTQTLGAGPNNNYNRMLGELGVDVALRASGTFAYRNERWKIDGLRHLVTPRLSYRYIPEADKGRVIIPRIDREAFSTYLPPLGLGDVRSIDDLRATNTLRLAIDNTVQTRDPVYGARDLLVFNLANDFRFRRAPGERDVSEIHTEMALMPARWLQLDLYESFAPRNFRLREFNTGITLHDSNAWSLRFSNNFLRRELEDYAIDGRVRINEAYEFLTRLHYDARKRRFNEQAYGITQNVGNTWAVSYVVTLYSGPRRESNFGLRVQIDTVRF